MGQCAGPEPGIEQVQDRMFDPANILFDRQPFGDFFSIERLVRRLAGKTQEIPRTVDEGVERVGLSLCLAAACGAGDMLPRRMTQQRVARSLEIDIFWQRDRQAVFGRGNDAACIAMDEGDRRAPIALPRYAPVTQTPDGGALAAALCLDPRDHFALGIGNAHPVKEIGIDDHPVIGIRFCQRRIGLFHRRCNHARDWQAVFGCEIEIALVVSGHRHDRAGAVIHQHEIGDEDRQIGPGEGVPCGDAGIETELLGGFQFGSGGSALLAQGDEIARFVTVDCLCQLMVGCHRNEARAKNSVGPCGVNRQPLAI